MSGGFGNVPKRVFSGILLQILILVIGVVLTMHMTNVNKVNKQNTNTVTSVASDWKTIPFVKLTVTDDKCPSGTESVFTREWGGTEQGCLVNKRDTFGYGTTQTVMSKSEYDSYIRSRSSSSSSSSSNSNSYNNVRNREPCMPINMKAPETQDEFWDMRFCGKRGGSSFLNAERPKLVNGTASCPTDYVACSEATSANNTICVKKSRTEDCPFTLMKFINKSDESDYSATDYKVYEVDEDYSFVTSKTKGDSLPLTSFKVEDKPCLDDRDVSRAPNAQFYPLEKDRNTKECRVVPQFSGLYDTRYVDMGRKISEYEVQDESDVLDTLEDLPNYPEYVQEANKKNVKYGFWSRATIPWKLECDAKYSRSDVMAAASKEKDKAALHSGAVIWLVSIAYGGGILFSIIMLGMFIAGKLKRSQIGETGSRGGVACCLVVQMTLLGIALLLIFGQQGELKERLDSMKALSFVNECGDEFTQVPTNFVPEIEQASSKTNFCVILGVAQLILSLTVCISCVAAGKSKDDDDSDNEHKYEPVPDEEE